MTIFDAVLLGLLQALGEFLPISSSAHLVLLPYLRGQQYQGLAFDVMLHVATLLAVLLYFGKDWYHLIKASPAPAPRRAKPFGTWPWARCLPGWRASCLGTGPKPLLETR